MHQLCNTINSLAIPSSHTSNGDVSSSAISSGHSNDNAAPSDGPSSIEAYMLFLREDRQQHYNTMNEGSTSTPQLPMVYHVPNAQVLEAYSSIYPHLKVADSLPGVESMDHYQPCDENNSSEYDGNLVVWPECWTNLIDSLYHQDYYHDGDNDNESMMSQQNKKRKKHQTAIWWLSVDNNNPKFKDWKKREDIIHLYQSEYAKNHIIKNKSVTTEEEGIKAAAATGTTGTNKEQQLQQTNATLLNLVYPMTEYIPIRQPHVIQNQQEGRDFEVLYNPFKGIHYTDEIRKRSESSKMRFTPIGGGEHGNERISAQEVTSILHRAKVYIDFGPHPGMDRIPREAALANCIIITNKAGSAAYAEDVPIPEQYKVGEFNVDAIHKLLVDSLENYETRTKNFDKYREWINGQTKRMEDCVGSFLENVGSKRVVTP